MMHKKTVLEKGNKRRYRDCVEYFKEVPTHEGGKGLWRSYTNLESTRAESGSLQWDDICFISKKYKNLLYYAVIETSIFTACDVLNDKLADLTAKKLGFNDWYDWTDHVDDLKFKSGPTDPKTKTSRIYIPMPTFYPKFDNMDFNQIEYNIVWPEVRDKIDTIIGPIYKNNKSKVNKNDIWFTAVLDVDDLTIDVVDDFVDSFHASGERFIYKKDESTLCKNINFDTLRTWIDETASTLGRPISEKDRKQKEEEHATWLTLPPKY